MQHVCLQSVAKWICEHVLSRKTSSPRIHSNPEQSLVLLPFQVLTNPDLIPEESIFPPHRRDEGNFAGQIHGDGKVERGLEGGSGSVVEERAKSSCWLETQRGASSGSREQKQPGLTLFLHLSLRPPHRQLCRFLPLEHFRVFVRSCFQTAR